MQFDPDTFKHVLKTYSKETLGCDMWSRSELLGLPDIALKGISCSLDMSIANMVWPHRQLLSLSPCLGKPGGGVRTKCKTPMTYRMALGANATIALWEKNNMQTYDTATKGSSALTAALIRNVRAEIADWLNMLPATIFNDYRKLFDTMDIETLIQAAVECNFPLQELVLCMSQHLAPRIIQVAGCSSEPISIFKSILAGCKFSKALTALYLQTQMKEIDRLHKESNLGVFMDDTCMQYIAKTSKQILSKLVPCMKSFKRQWLN